MIDDLISSEGLVDVVISNLTNYSKTTQSILHHVVDKVEIKKHAFVGKYDHQTNIDIRLNFLTFLATYSSYKVSFNELSLICELFIDQSQIVHDKEAVVNWLKTNFEQQDKLAEIFDLQDDNVKNILKENLNEGSISFDS